MTITCSYIIFLHSYPLPSPSTTIYRLGPLLIMINWDYLPVQPGVPVAVHLSYQCIDEFL